MPRPERAVPVRKLPLFTPYVIVWSLSAVLSAGYLAVLALAPNWLDDLGAHGTRYSTTLQGAPASIEQSRLIAEVEGLRSAVNDLQVGLTDLKRDTAATKKSLLDEVGQLRAALYSADPEDSAANKKDAAQISRDAPNDSAVSAVTGAGGPSVVPSVINSTAKSTPEPPVRRDQATAVETGSVGTATKTTAPSGDIQFGEATVTRAETRAAGPAAGVVISNGESVDSLRLSWSLLAERYGAELRGLEPRYMLSTDPSGGSFDLVAGPLANRNDAAALCKSLQSRNIPCRVSDFGGNAL